MVPSTTPAKGSGPSNPNSATGCDARCGVTASQRGLESPHRQGVRRARRRKGLRLDDDRQHRVTTSDGKGGVALRADVRHRLVRQGPRRRARRCSYSINRMPMVEAPPRRAPRTPSTAHECPRVNPLLEADSISAAGGTELLDVHSRCVSRYRSKHQRQRCRSVRHTTPPSASSCSVIPCGWRHVDEGDHAAFAGAGTGYCLGARRCRSGGPGRGATGTREVLRRSRGHDAADVGGVEEPGRGRRCLR